MRYDKNCKMVVPKKVSNSVEPPTNTCPNEIHLVVNLEETEKKLRAGECLVESEPSSARSFELVISERPPEMSLHLARRD